VDRAGRKLLMVAGYGIAGLACLLMTISLLLKDQVLWMSYASIGCVILFIIGFAIGPGEIKRTILLTVKKWQQMTSYC